MAVSSKVDDDVITAILAGTSIVTRRAEIYESDGTTLWIPSAETPRMIEGTVSIDYSRAERRTLDVMFDNSDGILKHDPNGFWYDKIIKVFRGVQYRNLKVQPSILIINDTATAGHLASTFFKALGFTDIFTNPNAATLDDLYGYDIIVANGGTAALPQPDADLLALAFDAGYNVMSIGSANTVANLPRLYTTTVAKSDTAVWGFNQTVTDNPLRRGWVSSTLAGNTNTGTHVTGLVTGVFPVATFTWTAQPGYTAAILQSAMGGRWFDLHLDLFPQTNANLRALVKNALNWLYTYQEEREYETQVGEFMIDSISHDFFPRHVKVAGRDYAKKIMLTKFANSLTFVAGTNIDTLVQALAANAGVTKFIPGAGGASLTSDISFARDDDRWKAISDCCTATGIEVFFDAQGYLITRPFRDPVSSPTTLTLSVAEADANLTELSISSSDTSIKNNVIVTSENGDSAAAGFIYQGSAANDDPDSPTRRSRIGERTFNYSTAVATSDAQCKMIAQNFLRVMALEEWNLEFEALVFPWVEAGDIVSFENPDTSIGVPDNFLLTDISIPLGLGTMSGTCKRVTIVGSRVS